MIGGCRVETAVRGVESECGGANCRVIVESVDKIVSSMKKRRFLY